MWKHIKASLVLFKIKLLSDSKYQLGMLFIGIVLSLASFLSSLALSDIPWLMAPLSALNVVNFIILLHSRQWDRKFQEVDPYTGYEIISALIRSGETYPLKKGSLVLNLKVYVKDEIFLERSDKLEQLVQQIAREAQVYLEGTSLLVSPFRASTSELLYILELPPVSNTYLLKNRTLLYLQSCEDVLDAIAKRVSKEISLATKISVGASVAGIHGDNAISLVHYSRFVAQSPPADGSFAVCRLFDPKEFQEYEKIKHRRNLLPSFLVGKNLNCFFQVIYDFNTDSVYGYEALSRPEGGIPITISELLDDSEALGQYYPLEKTLLTRALYLFEATGGFKRDLKLFINTTTESIPKHVADGLLSTLEGKDVVVEITERTPIHLEDIQYLKSHLPQNVQIAIDDFGTGYSNYLTLLSSHPDIIKVSSEFIREIHTSESKQEVYSSIVQFARVSGVKILAEGIETPEEMECILSIGVDYGQGYFLGRPGPTLQGIDSLAKEFLENK
jgi:EAL domain-containing protein (putative c-di-GMP-specific phosphodiesterase class I)